MFSINRNTMPAFYLFVFLLTNSESLAAGTKYYLNTKSVDLMSYRLIFRPNFEHDTFELRCIWLVKQNDSVSTYEFNRRNLQTNADTTYRTKLDPLWIYQRLEDNLNRVGRQYLEPNDIATYEFLQKEPPGYYYLDFRNIKGTLQNNFRGFYVDEYTDENGGSAKFLTTQFAPIGARYAFPSWDEPRYRSKFIIMLTRPKDYTCIISNYELKNSIITGNVVQDEFAATEMISPSSLTFTISKFEVSKEVEGSIHRIVGRPKIFKFNQYEYVAPIINRAYKEIENFLRVSCELKTLYHVAIPSNRMHFETLCSYRGINHYKERLLIISNQTFADRREKSVIAITKLIAQQWFLSYLMVDTWTSVWISEGLTNYLAYNVTAKLYPSWIIHERLANHIRSSMLEDSKCCGDALNSEARKSSQIEAKFNIVTVYKGTALITMMERLLPQKVFTTGITNLIKDKKWSNYNAADLYQKFESILKLDNSYEKLKLPKKFSEIMSVWESTKGYPVVRVVRNYDTYDLDYIDISQKRFYFDDSAGKAVWPIPITFATKSFPNFKNTRPTDWLNTSSAKIRIKSLKKTDWLILNNQATYYYRVHYDDENWRAIATALMLNHESIHYLNRMQIIDDAFSLAEYGMLRYSIALDISQYIMKERDYAPLKAMKEAWYAISKKLVGSEHYNIFQKFIKKSVENVYDKVKSMPKPKSPKGSQTMHRNHLTMELLFSWLCELKSKKCEVSLFRTNFPLDKRLMTHVEMRRLCNNIAKSDEKKLNELYDKYKNLFKNSTIQIFEFNALGCSEHSSVLERFLKYVILMKSNKLIELLKLLISQGSHGLEVSIKSISIVFKALLKLAVEKDIKTILTEIGSRVTTGRQLQMLEQFSNKEKKYGDLIKPCITRAKQNIEWRKRYLRSFGNNLQAKTSRGTALCNNVYIIIFITISYFANFMLC